MPQPLAADNRSAQLASVMIRTLEGRITLWNPTAEQIYGWSKDQAVGSVSHSLLKTIFPCPLSEINTTLQKTGVWEGDLIHTLRSGRSVRVRSRWELQREEGQVTIFEINRGFQALDSKVIPFPGIQEPIAVFHRSRWRLLHEYQRWWVVPLLLVFVAFALFLRLTHQMPQALGGE